VHRVSWPRDTGTPLRLRRQVGRRAVADQVAIETQ
jgi:hypothetical protein